MFKFLHRLWNPHCEECRVCQSCETLKMQLSIANIEKKQLLESLLSITKPEIHPETRPNYEDVKPKLMTWNIRKQLLEQEDRKAAALMKEKEKVQESISELEKELGIPDAS